MNTVKLAFESFGLAEKEPLIILHGFFASSRNWRQMAQKLSDTFHVYVPDNRNHGSSPHHAQMDYPSMANDLLAFMEAHQLNKAHLLGHSMGGKIAMWFALNYPQKVDKLIVADIAPITYQHSFDNLIDILQALPLDEIETRKQADDWLVPFVAESSSRQFLLQNLLGEAGRYHWRIDLGIFKQMADYIVSFPSSDNLDPYKGKTLFLIGANSPYVAKRQYSLFPDAQFIAIPDAAHWLHIDQPGLFAKQVNAFLNAEN